MRRVLTVVLVAAGIVSVAVTVAALADAPSSGPAVQVQPAPSPGLPTPAPMDSPTLEVLRGYTVPEFEAEMQQFVIALGVSCGFCHVPRNFASDDNPRKMTARRMIEMTLALNRQYFPDHRPAAGESRLGKVTCFTCHQGQERPATSLTAALR
jgi:hypothetical protein